jgi:hypothetical protein
LHIALATFQAIVLPDASVRQIALSVSLFQVLDVPKHAYIAGFLDVWIDEKTGSVLIFSDQYPLSHDRKASQLTQHSDGFFHSYTLV